ncbi:rRNA maturation RNase YbeY [Candidatus Gracilibacteria bacterium]|nr:rRNA maturation RNase YbeY [Candidatus Gracilibacteria bacterium]
MFDYKIINNPGFKIDENIVKTIFNNINELETRKLNGTLNIVFVDEKTIQNLNSRYRHKDSVTDVLSFNYYFEFDGLTSENIAGELVFCEEKIKSQGIEYELGEEKEFYKLLIHSVFHIIGYDHMVDEDFEIMSKKEETIWNKIYGK